MLKGELDGDIVLFRYFDIAIHTKRCLQRRFARPFEIVVVTGTVSAVLPFEGNACVSAIDAAPQPHPVRPAIVQFFELIMPSIRSAAVPGDVLADVEACIAISIFEEVVLIRVKVDKALFAAFLAGERAGGCRGRRSIDIFNSDIAGI